MAENSQSESSDNTEEFIQLFHDNPCLWKVSDDAYKNRYIRDGAVRDMSNKLKLPPFEVKEKIRKLRTQYQPERRKALKRKTRRGADE